MGVHGNLHGILAGSLGVAALLSGGCGWAAAPEPAAAARAPWLIAHRGASAYAPENTIPAFVLALEQGADYVEFDLRMTRDGVLVCLHDASLERTTNVADVFPDRAREIRTDGQTVRRWPIEDFALDEVRQLDAGAWFDGRFTGTRVPTFQETIDALRGRAGLFIELKSPEAYPGMEERVLEVLRANGLDRPGADPRTPVLLQSFSASSLERLAGPLGTPLAVHLLFSERDAAEWTTEEGLERVRQFATGLSPEKRVVLARPEMVGRARELGLLVTPYTFRADAVETFADVRAEMAHYVRTLGVDGVITDNPDQMPRQR